MENYTILGGSGFIGSNLARVLDNPFCPTRAELYSIDDRNLGHVFYCLGDDSGAIEPNLGYLLWFLKNRSFESLVYLSSTRVYLGAESGSEDAKLIIAPHDRFNAIKIAAEVACSFDERCTVARLSTVVGLNDGDYLIPGLVRGAVRDGVMEVDLTANSVRDFISIKDVIKILPMLRDGEYRLYNVAFGANTSIESLALAIQSITNAVIYWNEKTHVEFPQISTRRIEEEFGFFPGPLPLNEVCKQYKDIYVDQILA